MGRSSEIVADSVNSAGCRITTYVVTFERMILAEINTHRVFSRNTASSRAIPVSKLIEQVVTDPVIPAFGKNQSGMSASEIPFTDAELEKIQYEWLEARDNAVESAELLRGFGLHKQHANRILEPFMWVTAVITATDFENFFSLRSHPAAQPEIRALSDLMQEQYRSNVPKQLADGEWHIPFAKDKLELFQQGYSMEQVRNIAVGRLCRVSYLTHDGVRDPQKDLDLFNQLVEDRHYSPLEHVAQATNHAQYIRNHRGFRQLRSLLDGQ